MIIANSLDEVAVRMVSIGRSLLLHAEDPAEDRVLTIDAAVAVLGRAREMLRDSTLDSAIRQR